MNTDEYNLLITVVYKRTKFLIYCSDIEGSQIGWLVNIVIYLHETFEYTPK